MTHRILALNVTFALALLVSGARAEPPPVDFQRDVFAVLQDRCFACHGGEAQEGQLRLDARALALQGGISGQAIEPGRGEASLLVRRLRGSGEQDRMPLDEEPLGERQIAAIVRWIDQGARWPEDVGADDDRLAVHWAYQPARSEPPTPPADRRQAAWIRTSMDAFIWRRMAQHGLSPSPPAERARLLRRVSLDLVGLPPTPQQLKAFLADTRPDAYARVVDRLLASPRYGERWARPWLDLARYADSNGYQADQYRSVWPYRDWVIRSMNQDMSFRQFTIEQLAGDLLPGSTLEQKIATGFHRLTTCNVEAGVDPEENRVEQVIDRVNTTGTVWLGTTIECAQCHSHKYDPFTQEDYYRLLAYFNSTPLEVEGNGVTYNFTGPKMPLPLRPEQRRNKQRLQQRHKTLAGRLAQAEQAAIEELPDWERQARRQQENASQWHVLQIESFQSEGGASYQLLPDQSLLVTGKKPAKDVYTIVADVQLADVTGLRLETLTDDSLPGKGPGRGSAERPNFVLHELTASASGQSGTHALQLCDAEADFSQARWAVAGAVDGDAKTGWAINPQFGKPHWATFRTAETWDFSGGVALTVQLSQQYGGARTIGRLRLSVRTGDPGVKPLPETLMTIVDKPDEQRTDEELEQLREHFLRQRPEVASLRKKLAALDKQLAAIAPDTTLVMVEMDEPRETRVFRRGSFLDPQQAVTAGTPAALPEPTSGGSRLQLARWLVDRGNPLTARVVVNRWWHEFFGRGLVESLEDFGSQGEPCTHPQLLDHLAVGLMEHGWSRKWLHRQIVLSSTYRQSSRVTAELLERDPYNELYARGPRHRLSAEMLRDQALRASGLLSTNMGGPPVYPPQPPNIWRHVGRNAPKYNTSRGADRHRRALYTFWRRSAPYPNFTAFDAPDRSSCTVKRPRTNTPLQALALLNDPAYFEMAAALARRMAAYDAAGEVKAERPPGPSGAGPSGRAPRGAPVRATSPPRATSEEVSGDDAQRVAYGFRLCLARSPRAAEAEHLLQVFQRERRRFQDDPEAARTLLEDVTTIRADEDPASLAAWVFVANILLNLDETITKG